MIANILFIFGVVSGVCAVSLGLWSREYTVPTYIMSSAAVQMLTAIYLRIER